MKDRFLLVIALSVVPAGSVAMSCPDLDPYEVVEFAYQNSDLVFIGSIEESAFEGHLPRILVDAKWKGPEVRSISMRLDHYPKPNPRVFFAARSDNPTGWSDRYPNCFFGRRTGLTVEHALIEIYGNPIPPSVEVPLRIYVAFLGVLFAAIGGIGVLMWHLRLKFPS